MEKSDKQLWRGTPEEYELYAARKIQVTAKTISAALENARHPISCEIPILRRFEPMLDDPEKLSDCAIRCYAKLVTDDDPQAWSLIVALMKRKFYDVEFRPNTNLKFVVEYIRNPSGASSRAITAWNVLSGQVYRQRAFDAPDFDLAPFQDLIGRLKQTEFGAAHVSSQETACA